MRKRYMARELTRLQEQLRVQQDIRTNLENQKHELEKKIYRLKNELIELRKAKLPPEPPVGSVIIQTGEDGMPTPGGYVFVREYDVDYGWAATGSEASWNWEGILTCTTTTDVVYTPEVKEKS